jgi:hypothetical protein
MIATRINSLWVVRTTNGAYGIAPTFKEACDALTGTASYTLIP